MAAARPGRGFPHEFPRFRAKDASGITSDPRDCPIFVTEIQQKCNLQLLEIQYKTEYLKKKMKKVLEVKEKAVLLHPQTTEEGIGSSGVCGSLKA